MSIFFACVNLLRRCQSSCACASRLGEGGRRPENNWGGRENERGWDAKRGREFSVRGTGREGGTKEEKKQTGAPGKRARRSTGERRLRLRQVCPGCCWLRRLIIARLQLQTLPLRTLLILKKKILLVVIMRVQLRTLLRAH